MKASEVKEDLKDMMDSLCEECRARLETAIDTDMISPFDELEKAGGFCVPCTERATPESM